MVSTVSKDYWRLLLMLFYGYEIRDETGERLYYLESFNPSDGSFVIAVSEGPPGDATFLRHCRYANAQEFVADHKDCGILFDDVNRRLSGKGR